MLRIFKLDPRGDLQDQPQPVDELEPIQVRTSPDHNTFIKANFPLPQLED